MSAKLYLGEGMIGKGQGVGAVGWEGMDYEIRLARAEDATQIAECVKEVYDEYSFTWEPDGYHADLYDLTEYLDEAQARFWVAEQGARVLGCGGVMYHELFPGTAGEFVTILGEKRIAATDGELIRYYVRPSARRLGIASKILALAIEDARARGRVALEIWSDKRFTDAHRMYEKLGAIRVSDRICDDPDVSPEWGMILPIH